MNTSLLLLITIFMTTVRYTSAAADVQSIPSSRFCALPTAA